MHADTTLETTAGPSLAKRLTALSRNPRALMSAGLLVASRGGAVVLQFLTQLALASVGGAASVGLFQLLTSWTCIAGEIIALGLPARSMRDTAVDSANDNRYRITRRLKASQTAIWRVWAVAVVLTGLTACLLALTGVLPLDQQHYATVAAAAIIGAPLFALLRLYAESLKALGKATAAVALESLTSPLVILLLCALCWQLELTLLSVHLVLAYLLSLVIAPLAVRINIGKRLTQMTVGTTAQPAYIAHKHDLLFLWGTGMLSICFVQLPFIVLPWFATPAEIGVFALAHKLVNIITTLLLLLAAVYGPRFAQLVAAGKIAGLRHALAQTQLISTVIFLPSAVALLALSPLLPDLFGSEFHSIATYLLLLVLGQSINAITGLSGVLLTMAGQAKQELAYLAFALVTVSIGSIWVGAHYGAQGLTALFAFGIAIKNIGSWLAARKLLEELETAS